MSDLHYSYNINAKINARCFLGFTDIIVLLRFTYHPRRNCCPIHIVTFTLISILATDYTYLFKRYLRSKNPSGTWQPDLNIGYLSKCNIFHRASFNMTPWSIGVPVNRGIQPLKCEQTIACHAIIIITEQVRTLLKLLGVCEVCQELEFYNELDARLIFHAAVRTYAMILELKCF